MNKTRLLSFRLESSLLRKLDILTVSGNRSRGAIIREAIELYFQVFNPVIRESVDTQSSPGGSSTTC
jgi:predicted transcriptional regulator